MRCRPCDNAYSAIDARDAVEIPADTKARLGLDHERSWIVVNELNLFRWLGPDLRFITERNPSSIIYGRLPPRFFRPCPRPVRHECP
jgi:hypothetical protein